MNELAPYLLVGIALVVAIGIALLGLVLLKARKHPGGLRGSIEAWFRRPPKSTPAGRKHYYIPYWLSR